MTVGTFHTRTAILATRGGKKIVERKKKNQNSIFILLKNQSDMRSNEFVSELEKLMKKLSSEFQSQELC